MIRTEDLKIRELGERAHASPLNFSTIRGDGIGNFIRDKTRVLYLAERVPGEDPREDLRFQKAGPRERIFFDPAKTRAAVVTCGGLCPGLNNVIRAIVHEFRHQYGVAEVLGIRHGLRGLNPKVGDPPIPLTLDFVEDIHKEGGTVLGSTRGPQEPAVMVDFLLGRGIDMLFCIGGDGTQRAAHAIHEELARRGAPVAVVGIPKTIDNDIPFVAKSFGYSTALEKAREVIDCAHAEAKGTRRGIGLVRVMGRHAGFIAAGATLASQEVNFVLVPEIPFDMDGDEGFLKVLEGRMAKRHHAVIVVAEGAGQDHLAAEAEKDASGNVRLRDIGAFLKERIGAYFKGIGDPVDLKYIDPSYIIRSIRANGEDSVFCNDLARHAVHAAMAGKTDLLIGTRHDTFIHVPIPLATSRKKRISTEGRLWMAVLEATAQPAFFGRRVVDEETDEL
ncbi:MAG: ATP-dependent 6-phosphofructokinase [Candidatus Eisenbacteria bacterium]|nr:ATP-dependent 6-phosphofructokinase [Candidatus Eisenbacteria bacterium]